MGAFQDLTGRIFGRLKVLRRLPNTKSTKFNPYGYPQYECQCMCKDKTILTVSASNLKYGHTTSCGCVKREKSSLIHIKDLTGKTFGRLRVLHRSPNRSRRVKWVCQCSCVNGTILEVSGDALVSGRTKSCGCLMRERLIESNILRTKWKTNDDKIIKARFNAMKQRCYNSKYDEYHHYGGRGIRICDEWLNDPSTFVEWSKLNGFRSDLTIDRIDVNGPYAPWNCRWVDWFTQSNNKRSNVYVDINGVRHTISEWSRLCGVVHQTLGRYLQKGYELFKDVVLFNLSLKENNGRSTINQL